MKTMTYLFVLAVCAALFAGCASNRGNAGGVGNQSQESYGQDNSPPPPPLQHPTGPNNSIGAGNPFGLGPGNVEYQNMAR